MTTAYQFSTNDLQLGNLFLTFAKNSVACRNFFVKWPEL